jgi:preprotein translocase subunit Sss1
MDIEERIAKWERVTVRFIGFVGFTLTLLVGLLYGVIEAVKFLIHRFSG